MTDQDARPAVGATYLLGDADYRFGTGALLARVTQVLAPMELGEGGRTGLWWHVEAMCKHPSETTRPGHLRQVYLRAASLKAARRPA